MEKERKKRVVTTTNQWIKNELTPEQELELLQQIKNEKFLEKDKDKEKTPNDSQIKLVLQQLENVSVSDFL